MVQTVIVTGGSNGIGKEIVRVYAEHGHNVIFADVDLEEGHLLSAELKRKKLNVDFFSTDVRSLTDIRNLIEFAINRYETIDVLINNAGKSVWVSPYDITIEQWEDVIQTNLRSVLFASREAAKAMKKNLRGGLIVNISSTRATMSEPNSEAYAATKGAIISITHALAASLGHDGIRVNSVSPRWIETGNYDELRSIDHAQHFSKRVGKPADIAKACMYLTEPTNDFVTGTNLVVDGGMTKKMIYEH
ncbi:SDR family NAD(P)-dependent oxidoreductase [Metabacillus herbersteinensis]|uniref:SDR family NAD(P)-dependent oxidoreductase n=1 Tax=Metabacillus herbersteinensis TaxID=283816 RepID=A0ABV6GMH0_9BACI